MSSTNNLAKNTTKNNTKKRVTPTMTKSELYIVTKDYNKKKALKQSSVPMAPNLSFLRKGVNNAKTVMSKKSSKSNKIIQLAYRCTGLAGTDNHNSHRCKHRCTKSDLCPFHINQVGRIDVQCSGKKKDGKHCKCHKILPVYQDADGNIRYDMYLCKAHAGYKVSADTSDSKLDEYRKKHGKVSLRVKVKGVWFYQVSDTDCMGCAKKGDTHGYFCSDCSYMLCYTTIRRCKGTTKNGSQCRHEKKMLSTNDDYYCSQHRVKA